MTRTDELTGTRITAALETLAERRVSGILEIDGDPAGTIYLDRGQITFARSSWIPDLGTRLFGVLQSACSLPGGSPDLIADPDQPDRDIGTMLVQCNYLSRGDLVAILRSLVVDVALVLMVPTDEDMFVSDIRFAARGAHWAGAFSSLCVDVVRSEAIRRAERMARFNLARTTPVRLRDLSRPSAVLNRDQWAIACAIDGALSVQDLAWRCGLALCDTIECVGYLIQAGVCVPEPRRAGPRVLVPTAVLPPGQAGLPLRVPEADGAHPVTNARVWANVPEPPGGGDFAPAQPELLRRVLDGLRRLG